MCKDPGVVSVCEPLLFVLLPCAGPGCDRRRHCLFDNFKEVSRPVCHAQESFAAMQRAPVHVRKPDLTPVSILPGNPAHGAHLCDNAEFFRGLCACKYKPCSGNLLSHARLQYARQAISAESVCGNGQCCLMRSAARTTTCRPLLTASPQQTMSAWPGSTVSSACVWQARPLGMPQEL